jgi:hypothetical protein
MPYVCAKSKHAEPQRMKADSQNVFTFAGSPQLADINLIKKGLTVLGSSGRKKTNPNTMQNPAQSCPILHIAPPARALVFQPGPTPGGRVLSAFIGVHRRLSAALMVFRESSDREEFDV